MHQGVDIDWQQQLHEPHEEEGSQQRAEVQLQPCGRPGHVLHPLQLNAVLWPLFSQQKLYIIISSAVGLGVLDSMLGSTFSPDA